MTGRERLRALNDSVARQRRRDQRWARARRVRRYLTDFAAFMADTVRRYWWAIVPAPICGVILAAQGKSPAWLILGFFITLAMTSIWTSYDRQIEGLHGRLFVTAEALEDQRELNRDLAATVAALMLDNEKIRATGGAPGVWIGDTWYEVEVES